MRTLRYLLEEGVDINYNAADMVYPYKATPLTVAARSNNLKMVQFLVEQGADVTLQEKDGERAYTIAVSQNNEAMATYLKEHEPEAFHNLSNRLHALKPYKLPPDLITFLSVEKHRLELPPNASNVHYVDFFHLIDTVEMKSGRQKLLRLSADVDQYSHLIIVWNPSKKAIGYADIEHQEYGQIAPLADFMAAPGHVLAQYFEAL